MACEERERCLWACYRLCRGWRNTCYPDCAHRRCAHVECREELPGDREFQRLVEEFAGWPG